jgi:hypothetical protein
MGFDKDSVLELSLPDDEETTLKRFKDQILNNTLVKKVTFSNTGTASSNTWSGDIDIFFNDNIIQFSSQIKFTDEDFIYTYII